MHIFSVLKFELKRNFKSILIFAGVVGGFILMMAAIFEPGLFAEYNDIMAGMSPEILNMIGGLVDLSTFQGFFNMYIFEFAWMWYGIYLILKVAQDIPGEMENKTIDLVLSKPIKRWEFVLGKQLAHGATITAAILSSMLFTVVAIAVNANVGFEEVDLGGFMLCFLILGFLLITIESAVLLISTILGSKKATAVGFAVVMGLWFLSAYSGSIPVDNIEVISFFSYFDTRAILINGILDGILEDILVLVAYSAVFTTLAVIYFTKRDIPV